MANNDVLTEDEMGALRDSVASNPVSSEDNSEDLGPRRFDFAKREQGLLAQLPGLELINERQVTNLSDGLQKGFRIPIDIELSESRILKHDEFLKSVPINACINLSRLTPLSGLSLVVVPADLLSLLVDSYFGGSLKESYAETAERNLTNSEFSINRRINEKFNESIAVGWEEVLPLSPEIVGCETNPELLPARSLDELVVLFNFDVRLANHAMAIQWLFPYAALESVRKLLVGSVPASKNAAVDADWEPVLRQELMNIDAEMTAVLTHLNLTLGEILELTPGSILHFGMPEKVALYMGDSIIAEAEYGASNGKKAVKLIS